MQKINKQPVGLFDPVQFRSKRGLERGFIASVTGKKAHVVTDDGVEYSAPLAMLDLRPNVRQKRVYSRNHRKRMCFEVGDFVSWRTKSKILDGIIEGMNPQRAVVNTGDESWNVPYAILDRMDRNDRDRQRLNKLDAIAAKADALLKKHQLDTWRFAFNHAHSQAGHCDHNKSTIYVAWQYCLKADKSEVLDTILHEISHALVGPKHGHDDVWRKKALEIGCSGSVTHCVKFASAKYIATCPICRWRIERHRRKRNVVCKKCRSKIIYELSA